MFCVFLEVMDTDSANPQSVNCSDTDTRCLSPCTRGPWGEKTALLSCQERGRREGRTEAELLWLQKSPAKDEGEARETYCVRHSV